MKSLKTVLTSLAFLGFAGLMLAQGTPTQRTTKLTVSEPTEVSGTILQPGSYTLKVLDFKGGKVQVQVTDDNDSKVYATVTAIRLRRSLNTNQQQAEQTQFTYTTANGHPALSTWYYPGDEWGEQFTTGLATWTVAENNVGTVTQTPMETKTETKVESKTAELSEAPAPAPAVEAPAPSPEPAAAPTELPKTASDLPLIGLVGLLALGGAAGVHLMRK